MPRTTDKGRITKSIKVVFDFKRVFCAQDNNNGGHAGGEQAHQGANARPLHWLPHHHRGAGIPGQREHHEHDHDDQGQAGHQGRPRLQEGHQAVVICDGVFGVRLVTDVM